MLKVLIADISEMFCAALTEQLERRFSVRSCHEGKQVLDICYGFVPDILILDMALPGMDGVGILRALQSSGRHMKILATTTCYHSDYMLQTFVQLGVEYILPKPCTVAAVVSRVQEMALMRCGRIWGENEETDSLLLNLGVRMSLGGYCCVHEAVRLVRQDNTQPITKVVYPAVAEACGGSAKRVERAIRSAIIDAWKNRDERVWRLYFAPGRDGQIPCPTNSHFIARMALCLESKKIS